MPPTWAMRTSISRHKLEVLKQHCDEVGRDYNEIVRSTGVTVHLIQSGRDAEKETAKARGSRSYEEYARDTIVGRSETVVERLQRWWKRAPITSSSRFRVSPTIRNHCGSLRGRSCHASGRERSTAPGTCRMIVALTRVPLRRLALTQ